MEPLNNSVKSLQTHHFLKRTLQEKLRVKELGPDHPDIKIEQQTKDRGRIYTRSFSRTWFSNKTWLTACSEANALFCFPCLLYEAPGADPAWTKRGTTDLKHFSERVKKHEQSGIHMENALRLAMLGKAKVSAQLDEAYRVGIRKHNEEVDRNRHILSKIIDCVKFCGAFELALRGHDENETSENPGIFSGLVDFVASLDAVLHEHLHTATVFKGTSKTVLNELLDCMLVVLKECVIKEIRSSDFVSIQGDETTDISTLCQLVLVIRYIDQSHCVQERFFEFIPLQSATADSIASALLDRLSSILPDDQKSKLISQTYNSASVVTEATGGVQKKVQNVYENAHYIHCYAHQLNLIMQQVTSHIPEVSNFFSDLAGFCTFFSRSSKRIGVLDEVVARRLPRASSVRWNFHSRAVNTVFENKEDLLQCFETIRDSGAFDSTTVREAGGFVRLLEDESFSFFLKLFHLIMPHVDILYSQLQRPTVHSVFVKEVMQLFAAEMKKLRCALSDVYPGPGLVFVVYPQAFANMPVSQLWAVMFFFMLLCLGLDSEFAMVEVMVTSLMDEFYHRLIRVFKRKELFVLAVCGVALLLGIPCVMQVGIYVFQLMDHYTAIVSIMFLAFFEIIAICWSYGVKRLSNNLEEMTGRKPNIIFRFCWLIVDPVLITVILIFSIIQFKPARYENYVFPPWAQGVGWVIALASIIWIPLAALHTLWVLPGSFIQKLKLSITPFTLDEKSKTPYYERGGTAGQPDVAVISPETILPEKPPLETHF